LEGYDVRVEHGSEEIVFGVVDGGLNRGLVVFGRVVGLGFGEDCGCRSLLAAVSEVGQFGRGVRGYLVSLFWEVLDNLPPLPV